MLISATTIILWRLWGRRVLRAVCAWSLRQKAIAAAVLALLVFFVVLLLLPAKPRARRLQWPPPTDRRDGRELRTWDGCVVISAVGERRPELFAPAVLTALAALNRSNVYLLLDSSNVLSFRSRFRDAVRDSIPVVSSAPASASREAISSPSPRLQLLNMDTTHQNDMPAVDPRLVLSPCVNSWFALFEFVITQWKTLLSDGEAGGCGGGQILLLTTPLAILQANPFYAYAGERSASSFGFWNREREIPTYSSAKSGPSAITPNEYLLFTDAADISSDSVLKSEDQSVFDQLSGCLRSPRGETLLARQPRLLGAGRVVLGTLFTVRAFFSLQRQLLARVAERVTEEKFRPAPDPRGVSDIEERIRPQGPDVNRGLAIGADADTGSGKCLKSCAIADVLSEYSVFALDEHTDSKAGHSIHNDLTRALYCQLVFT